MATKSEADLVPFILKKDERGNILKIKASGPNGGFIAGSIQQTNDGVSYLVAGSNMTVVTQSNGQIVVSALGGAPSGPAGGDLMGSYPNPELVKKFDDFASYVVIGLTSSLQSERVLAAGTGITISDGGAGGNVTISINDSVVATVSGSRFHGSVFFDVGLSGSLTRLIDGTSYLVAGSGVTIASTSNGQVTISSTASTPSDSVFATLSGSRFHGNLEVVGTASFDVGLSGSLTRLVSGQSYIAAGGSVSVVSQSNGQIVISGSGITDLTAGTGIIVTAGSRPTVAIDDSVVATLSGSRFHGNLEVVGTASFDVGLSGSLTRLIDGTSFIIAGQNITVTSQSNGSITIASTATATATSSSINIIPSPTNVSGTVETTVGSIYVTTGTYSYAIALLGSTQPNDTATLRMRRFTNANIILVLTGTGNLSSVLSTSSIVFPANDWYDFSLFNSSVSGSAVCHGVRVTG